MKNTTLLVTVLLGCTLGVAHAAEAPDALARVLDKKQLRVCSPGDYKPFSFEQDGKFEGLDIDLMQSLAHSLDAEVVMVKTSWSNLMADFTSGKCDIGAGGISVTLPRQQQAFFSTPYMINGKTPIVRCVDVSKFQTIENINKPDVRIVANPGGSNEKFAKTILSNAHLTMHKDNISIFGEVAEGRADVFVTEAAEAIVQSKLNPALCAVNPDKPLQYAEMAYLLPNGDLRFKMYIDQWLHLTKQTGEYQDIASKWLPE